MFKKIIFTYSLALFLFFPVFNTFFAQDDFFHFKVALTDGSLGAFIRFFGFYPFSVRGIAFYRPIFREVVYNIFYSLFGLNAFPFRILQFIIHFINIYLVYILTQKLFKNSQISFFTSLFFGITAANVGILYYLAGGIQASGATMFILASLLAFFNNRRTLSFLFFILALASHELSVILPILLAGLIFINSKSTKSFLLKSLTTLWPYILTLFTYLTLNLKVIGFSHSEVQYQPVFDAAKTINTLSWYGFWSLGLPEMTVDFVRPGLKLDPRLMRFWSSYFKLIFPAFFFSLAAIFLAAVRLLTTNHKKIFNKKLLFLLAWFFLSLFPVIFLPLHKKTYYLAPALPAFWMAVVYIVYSSKAHLFYLLAISLLVLNITSIKLGEKTYPAIQRGKISKKLIEDIKSTYPTLPKEAVFYIKNDPGYKVFSNEWGSTSKQAFYALSGSDALELLYNNSTLKVYYEDLKTPPPDSKIIEFVAVAD